MMWSLRRRYIFLPSIALFLVVAITLLLHRQPKPPGPIYKKPSGLKPAPPIVDNFPLALAAHSVAELPPIPRWSRPPASHVPEKTPLLIGFTRNWPLLQQAVVSYITAGWPPEDIYVVENTGVMDANKLGQLSLQNPFFLNHTRLEMLGVNVLITPTLLSFAQLQNFYIWTSTLEKWPHFFWSHMDSAVVSWEPRYEEEHPDVNLDDPNVEYDGFKSLYADAVDALREILDTKDAAGKTQRWAMRFFWYDRLALVNVQTFKEVGGWDTFIPFYMADCDMHARLLMAGYHWKDAGAGHLWDVGCALDDLIVLYRKKSGPANIPDASYHDSNAMTDVLEAIAQSEKEMEKANRRDLGTMQGRAEGWQDDRLGSDRFHQIVRTFETMQTSKAESKRGRNTWQTVQMGGKGEPFYRDSEGFELAIQMTIEHGRKLYGQKWGHWQCDIFDVGLKADDAWKVLPDW